MKDRDLGAAADLQGKDSGMWANPSSNPPLAIPSLMVRSWFIRGAHGVRGMWTVTLSIITRWTMFGGTKYRYLQKGDLVRYNPRFYVYSTYHAGALALPHLELVVDVIEPDNGSQIARHCVVTLCLN